MNALCFSIAVVFNRIDCATGLLLSSSPPSDSHDLPESTGNAISLATDDGHLRRSGNPTDDPNVRVPTASLKIVRRCAASVLNRTAEFREGRQHKDETNMTHFLRKSSVFFTDARLTKFLDNADHIYVMCMLCKRELPAQLRDKVSYLDGRLSDECFAKYLTSDSNDLGTHNRKVTLAHRVAIAHAQANNFKLPLVIEEDVVFKEDVSQYEFDSIAALIHSASREWEILRLAWYDHRESTTKECKRRHKRMCSQWAEQNMCTIETHLLHSSAAYMLPARSFDRFLAHPAGTTIDGGYGMLNQFKQTVLTPALCNQAGRYMDEELRSEPAFVKFCKVAR